MCLLSFIKHLDKLLIAFYWEGRLASFISLELDEVSYVLVSIRILAIDDPEIRQNWRF